MMKYIAASPKGRCSDNSGNNVKNNMEGDEDETIGDWWEKYIPPINLKVDAYRVQKGLLQILCREIFKNKEQTRNMYASEKHYIQETVQGVGRRSLWTQSISNLFHYGHWVQEGQAYNSSSLSISLKTKSEAGSQIIYNVLYVVYWCYWNNINWNIARRRDILSTTYP